MTDGRDVPTVSLPTPPTPLDRPNELVTPRKLLKPGDTLSRFTIVELLGEGGMGAVYRAQDAELGRHVAIKVLAAGLDAGPRQSEHEARLMREAQALAKVSHPNVIAIYDVARDQGIAFVAMELVEGESLRRWLRAKPRTRQEVLEMFMQAGHGLAGAHAAGLVHRDFKPDNVIVGSDGRVRVLDFGLARVAGVRAADNVSLAPDIVGAQAMVTFSEPRAIARESSPSVPLTTGSSGDLLATPLTRVGFIVGTPKYMAPEQHRGGEADARSDQFSFCIALYQALYGHAPFAGDKLVDLRANVLEGRVLEPPADTTVPAWLRRILLRGLAIDPEHRYPSMDALLADLAADPVAARRRRVRTGLVVATVIGLAGLSTWALLRSRAAPDPCAGVAGELAGAWDAPRRSAIEKAFTAAGRSYGADTFARVASGLDSYAQRWVDMRGETCRATRTSARQSQLVFDLRQRCLDRRRSALSALTELLAEKPDPELVDNSVDAVLALPPIAVCADIDALAAVVPPPTDPVTRAAVDAAGKRLARAEALYDAGKYTEADAVATPLVATTRALAYPPLFARALTIAATIKVDLDAAKQAEPIFIEAVRVAADARDNAAVFNAWKGIISARKMAGSYDEALAVRLPAEVAVSLSGNDARLRSQLLRELGEVYWLASRYDEALTLLQDALAEREKQAGPQSREVAEVAMQLGDVLADKGDSAAARPLVERALVINEKVFGPHHPQTALAQNSLALLLRDLGELGRARVLLDSARRIFEESMGAESMNVGLMWNNLGDVDEHVGQLADATTAYERAVTILDKSLGPDHPITGYALAVFSRHLTDVGRAKEAEPFARRGVAVTEKVLGREHRHTAFAYLGLGSTLCALGRYAEGETQLFSARRAFEKSVGPQHFDVSRTLLALGRCALNRGAPEAAVAPLERAVAMRERSISEAPAADARWQLARALTLSGKDRARAMELAKFAANGFRKAGGDFVARGDVIDAWLRAGASRDSLPN